MASDPVLGDAFGTALIDRLSGVNTNIVIERDDGFVDIDSFDYFYLASNDALWQWLRPRLGDRVLDIGAGAGRATLSLQHDGVDVVALDVSAACVEVCRRLGVTDTFEGTLTELATTSPAPFDSLLALGNNLGLIASRDGASGFFDAARVVGTPDVRLVGTMLDPYSTTNPVHLAYHERNRANGRYPGNVRIRVRYQNVATDWFELLWISPEELGALARDHGWDLIDTEPVGGVTYAAELRPA